MTTRIRSHARRALAGVRILTAVTAIGMAVLVTVDASARDTVAWAPPTLAETTVSELITDHQCWTGAAPDPDVIPGHAVVTLPGAFPELVPSAVGFGIWLEGDPGTLHAFCP